MLIVLSESEISATQTKYTEEFLIQEKIISLNLDFHIKIITNEFTDHGVTSSGTS